MTTPTPLAETIARVSQDQAKRLHNWESSGEPDHFIGDRDLTLLLRCARRCEAIEGITSELIAKARRLARIDSWWRTDIEEFKRILPPLLDAAAERDALAKRVGELELDFANACDKGRRLLASNDSFMASSEAANLVADKAEAESTRLRTELAELRLCHDEWKSEAGERHEELRKALAERNAAQDRVGELERELGLLVGKESDAWARAEGPITDPTQGTPWDFGGSPDLQDDIDRVESRPACIPADCQHFEQLPSGLWAWAKDDTVYIEDRNMPDEPWFIQSHWPTRDDAFLGVPRAKRAISEPDFLAARALGVRVLGWAK